MRILITTDWYIPAVNGVVSSVLALMKGLEERGHEVKILTLSQQNRSYTEGNVLYQAAHNCSFVYQKARFSLRMDKSILRRILDWKPDVIHSQCEFSTFRMAIHATALSRIFSERDSPDSYTGMLQSGLQRLSYHHRRPKGLLPDMA